MKKKSLLKSQTKNDSKYSKLSKNISPMFFFVFCFSILWKIYFRKEILGMILMSAAKLIKKIFIKST